MDNAHWHWWRALEHPRLHCQSSTWSGEEKYRTCAEKEGTYVFHVHLMEKKCLGLKILSWLYKKMGSQDQKESTLCLAPCNWNQACNKNRSWKDIWSILPTCNFTDTLSGTVTAQPKAAIAMCQKVGARYTEGIFCAGVLTVYTALCQAAGFLL